MPARMPQSHLPPLCRRYTACPSFQIVISGPMPGCWQAPMRRPKLTGPAHIAVPRQWWHQNNQRLPFGESQRHNAGAPKPYRYDSWLRLLARTPHTNRQPRHQPLRPPPMRPGKLPPMGGRHRQNACRHNQVRAKSPHWQAPPPAADIF